MVTKIGAKEEKRGVSREKATSDFVTSTLKQYRVILHVILAKKHPIAQIHEMFQLTTYQTSEKKIQKC